MIELTMIEFAGPVVDIDREEARELARQELSQPEYERDLSWPARVLEWLFEHFGRLIDGASATIPGGLGALLLVAVLLGVAIVAILRTGPLTRRRGTRDHPVFGERRRSAHEYRAAAAAAAQDGDWTTAVIEQFRAVVTDMEERGLIETRAGRTADEVAGDASAKLPGYEDDLTSAARLFDRILYGNQPATSEDHARMRELDTAVQHARPVASGGDRPALAVPR
ncbi:DUF4129 domain-containing protein [Actinobacteria bacterium YIM 96077]|uniref:Protein-glutamine gamma-glutamyltransferase-like C-terminal domain-containing protein n=1 Tax=Phytoactinopolyspora halophila TaxID=1981511 RepID=A0A329R3Z8_9ACTN|nr:DUF4129 domain-containing protein [Phytoactinopolyspora halophila]AYY12060.1 DUF4129 domain-containing protein [Actinobacteria bacterium YIM 96077]RAW18706.1 hypothetical protein DPM12_01120 [Phytoactinopolyspora halophila]